jgi:DNA-binding MarR family transcriptional regulator
MKTPGSLQQNLIYLNGEFSHQFHLALTAAFRAGHLKVTVEQFSILALLFYEKELNQQEISGLLHRDKTTMARVISNMEKNKLIRRMGDKRDGRSKLIFLTTKGEQIQQKAVDIAGQLYYKAMKGITQTELETGVKLMTKLIRNIS